MLRDVVGLSVEGTAEVLQISPQTAKTRLLRAKTAASDSRTKLAGCAEGRLPVRGRRLRCNDGTRVDHIWGWGALDLLPLLMLWTASLPTPVP
jgi:sigma-70-like protein